MRRQDTAGQERFRALGPIYYRDRRARASSEARDSRCAATALCWCTTSQTRIRLSGSRTGSRSCGRCWATLWRWSLLATRSTLRRTASCRPPLLRRMKSCSCRRLVTVWQLCGVGGRAALLHIGQAQQGHRGDVSGPDQACVATAAAHTSFAQEWCRMLRRQGVPGAAPAALWSATSRPRSTTTARAAERGERFHCGA